jgi:hypothetical protein
MAPRFWLVTLVSLNKNLPYNFFSYEVLNFFCDDVSKFIVSVRVENKACLKKGPRKLETKSYSKTMKFANWTCIFSSHIFATTFLLVNFFRTFSTGLKSL